MATTHTYMKTADLSYTKLIEWLGCALSDEELKDLGFENIDEAGEAFIEKTNDALPGSYLWLPHISEIYCNVNEDEDLDMESFETIQENVFNEL